jgi:hypothetical protein
MRRVTVRVPTADPARAMVLMREWLDLNRCEPTTFDCEEAGFELSVPRDAARNWRHRAGRLASVMTRSGIKQT